MLNDFENNGFTLVPCGDKLNTFYVLSAIPGFPSEVCIGQISRAHDGLWTYCDVIRQLHPAPGSAKRAPLDVCKDLRAAFTEVMEFTKRCNKLMTDENYEDPGPICKSEGRNA